MTAMLLTTPRLRDVEADLCMPGLGEHWRVRQCIQSWYKSRLDAGIEARRLPELLLSGAWKGERTYVEPTHANLQTVFGLPDRAGTEHVHIQPVATNTPNQAEWLIGKFHELKVTTVNVHVSPYHMLRAYGTVLSQLLKADMAQQVVLLPRATIVAPSTVVPETEVTGWDSVGGELWRLLESDGIGYIAKGDVASFEQLRWYLDNVVWPYLAQQERRIIY